MSVFLLTVAMVASLAASAFFSGAETGFLSVSRERILHLARAGGEKAKIVQKAISNMSETTITLLIGNNFANVTYSTVSAALILELSNDSTLQTIGSFIAAVLVLYVSEFMPKLLCAARPLRRILALAKAFKVVDMMISPISRIVLKITNFFLPGKDYKYKLTSADLVRILRDRKDGVCLSDIESALIGKIVVRRIKGDVVKPEDLLSVLADT